MTSEPRPGRPAGWRRFAAPLVAIGGAGLLVGAAAMPWWTRGYRDPLTGSVRVTLSGSQLVPALVPLALVVVAGLGAGLLTRGIARRIIGTAVSAAGLAAVVLASTAAAEPDAARFSAQLTRPAEAVAAAEPHVGGLVIAVAGGVLAALAGIVVMIARAPTGARTSAYESPSARREQARAAAAPGAPGARGTDGPPHPAAGADTAGVETADGSQLWRALDAGIDPTDPDPGDGHGG